MLRTLAAIAVGLMLVAGAIGALFYFNRGNHLDLQGSISKVTVIPSDEKSCVAVLVLQLSNPSDLPFQVHSIAIEMKDAAGYPIESSLVAAPDATRFLAYQPNFSFPTKDFLKTRDQIAPHQSVQRLLCIRYDVPSNAVESRQSLSLSITETDGAVAGIRENKLIK